MKLICPLKFELPSGQKIDFNDYIALGNDYFSDRQTYNEQVLRACGFVGGIYIIDTPAFGNIYHKFNFNGHRWVE